MPVNTGNVFEQPLGEDTTYADRREQDGSRYDNSARFVARMLARRGQEARRQRQEAEAEQQAIDDRAAEYSEYGNEAGMAEDYRIAERGAQGAAFGPWGAVAGMAVGAGEALVGAHKEGGWKQLGKTAWGMTNPFEAIPDSIEAVGGMLRGRNSSGIDDPRLGASRMQMAGNAAQQGIRNTDWSGGGASDASMPGTSEMGSTETLSPGQLGAGTGTDSVFTDTEVPPMSDDFSLSTPSKAPAWSDEELTPWGTPINKTRR